MSRYFFHVYDRDELAVQDAQGIDLPDETEVRRLARHMIEAVLAEAEFAPHRRGDRSFHVLDEHERIVVVVPFN